MTPDKWEKIKVLFLQAQKIPSEKREEFLEKECGDDPELRQEVEKLLDSYRDDDSFLEDTVIAWTELIIGGLAAGLGFFALLRFGFVAVTAYIPPLQSPSIRPVSISRRQ